MWYKTKNFSLEVKTSSRIESEELKKALLALGAKKVFFALEPYKTNGIFVIDGVVKYLVEDLDTEDNSDIMNYLKSNSKIHFFRV